MGSPSTTTSCRQEQFNSLNAHYKNIHENSCLIQYLCRIRTHKGPKDVRPSNTSSGRAVSSLLERYLRMPGETRRAGRRRHVGMHLLQQQGMAIHEVWPTQQDAHAPFECFRSVVKLTTWEISAHRSQHRHSQPFPTSSSGAGSKTSSCHERPTTAPPPDPALRPTSATFLLGPPRDGECRAGCCDPDAAPHQILGNFPALTGLRCFFCRHRRSMLLGPPRRRRRRLYRTREGFWNRKIPCTSKGGPHTSL